MVSIGRGPPQQGEGGQEEEGGEAGRQEEGGSPGASHLILYSSPLSLMSNLQMSVRLGCYLILFGYLNFVTPLIQIRIRIMITVENEKEMKKNPGSFLLYSGIHSQ